MAKKAQSAGLEKSMQNLEVLVEKMESGEMSLEESLKAFEQGVSLARDCQQALESAEQKVRILMDPDGDADDYSPGEDS